MAAMTRNYYWEYRGLTIFRNTEPGPKLPYTARLDSGQQLAAETLGEMKGLIREHLGIPGPGNGPAARRQDQMTKTTAKIPRKSIQQAADEYTEVVNSTRARWAHRKDGGHSGRTIRAATKALLLVASEWGYTAGQARQVLIDAKDLADLIYRAEEE